MIAIAEPRVETVWVCKYCETSNVEDGDARECQVECRCCGAHHFLREERLN